MTLKTIVVTLLVLLAAVSVYIGVKAGIQEIRTYQALKAEHVAVLKFLGEPVASQKGKDGKDEAINRAQVLDVLVAQFLQAVKTPADAAPSGK